MRHPILDALLDLVFAPVCLGCDGAIAAGTPRLVCARCRTRLRPPPAPACARCGATLLRTGRAAGPQCAECERWPATLRAARSAFLLTDPADRLVHQLKYRGWRALAAPMGELMARVALPADVRAEAGLVVSVPTTRIRLRERGYNQAALLAESFARHTGREHAAALERAGAAGSQTGLQPAARGANVAGAFRVRDGMRRRVAERHVLLVDDVLTTGATAAECGRALVDAEARCISVVTFARAPNVRRLT